MNRRVIKFLETIFNPTIEECEKYCFIVRGIEYQRDAVLRLDELKGQIAKIKSAMVQELDEDAANCCLSLEMGASALQHELSLWIAIKEDRMDDAWDELVSAESTTDAAVRAHKISDHMVRYYYRLQAIEKLLFPKIIFTSPGYTYQFSRCTICGSEYGSCDHLKGLAYMGEFCTQELLEVSIRELSIVDEPANRHARITSMTIDGVMRDHLTWRVVSVDPHEHVSNLEN